ncbi:hypothetical protein [Sporomusa termitida]|nr:hypothetical protein [Sporomusa termitida]
MAVETDSLLFYTLLKHIHQQPAKKGNQQLLYLQTHVIYNEL